MPRFLALTFLAAFSAGCIHVDPIEVHAVVDVNVKVDREVSNLLTDIYGDTKTVKAPNPASK